MFVTLFYGILQPGDRRAALLLRGHNPPLLFRAADQSMAELTTPGMALACSKMRRSARTRRCWLPATCWCATPTG